MKWILYAALFFALMVALGFGYPLFCMLKRFWGWRRVRFKGNC
jgi:hypothetical protein